LATTLARLFTLLGPEGLGSPQSGDSHRPETVTLGVGLTEDLARRDFTINAMAMDLNSTVTDLFRGREDLAAGIIRTVGRPQERFAEDGLRMFRAADVQIG